LVSLAEAKRLRYNQVLYHRRWRNADGSAQRWVVKGKPKTWKTRPKEVRVPIKRGMFEYGYLTQDNLKDFSLKEPKRSRARRQYPKMWAERR